MVSLDDIVKKTVIVLLRGFVPLHVCSMVWTNHLANILRIRGRVESGSDDQTTWSLVSLLMGQVGLIY